jgi:Bacterial dnaA protein helix-turn-helix
MATASPGRAARGCREAPARSARPCSTTASRFPGQGRGKANPRAKQPAPALESEEANMNGHSEIEEPPTAAEIIARYRDVRRRLYSPASSPKLASNETRTDPAACKAITTIPAPSRQPEQGPSRTPLHYHTPAREALRAVSTRTGVPLADILGRNRRPPIAAARHEAIWRVRLVTGWSLQRLGRFFKRDHTTVLHSVREMEKRSAHDPELRACMTALSLPQTKAAPTPSRPPISCSRHRL